MTLDTGEKRKQGGMPEHPGFRLSLLIFKVTMETTNKGKEQTKKPKNKPIDKQTMEQASIQTSITHVRQLIWVIVSVGQVSRGAL